jgi:hypothetical protein
LHRKASVFPEAEAALIEGLAELASDELALELGDPADSSIEMLYLKDVGGIAYFS